MSKTVIRESLINFLIFSFVGWVYEFILCIIHGEGLVNRGFLFGPWLPIYGIGGMLIFGFMWKWANEKKYLPLPGKKQINVKPVLVLVLIAAVSMVVELLATYIIEATGGDFRTLWDYSDRFLNFQGRIAIWPGDRFGILGVIILYLVMPLVNRAYKNEKCKTPMSIIFGILWALFIIDLIARIWLGSNY